MRGLIYTNTKKLIPNDELVNYMYQKGITFNIISKDDAINYLNNNTYYTKLSSYRKNFMKNKDAKYINLDFAHLKELSILDMYIRKICLEMCIDIEHYLKLAILNEMCDKKMDGVSVMENYLNTDEKARDFLKNNKSYCAPFIDNCNGTVPVWVFLEVASMGSTSRFYDYLVKNHSFKIINKNIIYRVASLRNACAHNNCLINNFFSRGAKNKNNEVCKFLRNAGVGTSMLKNLLSNRFLYEFSCMMYCYFKIVKSEPVKNNKMERLEELNKRLIMHKQLFVKNEVLRNAHKFFNLLLTHVKNFDNL